MPAAMAPHLADATLAEEDARRRGEVEAQRARSHSAAASGKSAWYFTLRRGSAIHVSTLSRHAA